MKFAYVGTFALVTIITSQIAQCETLRKIQGSEFPIAWTVLSLAFIGLVYFLLKLFVQGKCNEKLRNLINGMTITHTEIPHLLTFIFPFVNSGYYLLRLYLQGIVRYESKKEIDEEGNTVAISQLTLDEGRLEAIKAQGGRHSNAAISMVRYIRALGSCKISDLLEEEFTDKEDGNEIRMEIKRATKRVAMLVGFVLSVALALAWGVLLAKLQLGMMYGKNVGYLGIMIMHGIWITPFLGVSLYRKITDDVEENVTAEIRRKHCERPSDVNTALLSRANTSLPTELERNRILNAYYRGANSGMKYGFLKMAAETEENSFMYAFAAEYAKANDFWVEKARKAAEAAAASSSGCSSCSSCSSCGGCGGCGGCGD